MNKGSYLHSGPLSTIMQTPSFSQGLSGQESGTSISGSSVRGTEAVVTGLVVVVGLMGDLVVAEVLKVGLMVLALDVFIKKVGETLG